MIYLTIDSPFILRDQFIQYSRDYFTPDEYEAIFDFYSELGEDYNLDVIGICSDLTWSTWDELREELNVESENEAIDILESYTTILNKGCDRVLYFVY